jgi:hypothetical protein
MLVNRRETSLSKTRGVKHIDLYSRKTKQYRKKLIDYAQNVQNNDKIEYLRTMLNNMESMINYYTNKCPEGDRHNYDAKHRCTKCDFYDDIIYNNKDSTNYYNKYTDKFEIEKTNINTKPITSIVMSTNAELIESRKSDINNVDVDLVVSDEYLENVTTINTIYSINKNILLYLGQTETYTYNDLIAPTFKITNTVGKNVMSHVVQLNSYISLYFQFKSKNKLPLNNVAEYREIYNKYSLPATSVQLLVWIRSFLYADILKLHKDHPTSVKKIFGIITDSDIARCKSEPIIYAINTVDYQEEPDTTNIEVDYIEEKPQETNAE